MDIDNLKPNSHASKAPQTKPTNAPAEKKVEKVVKGKVKTKKNEIRKFTDIFVAEDVSNVKSYLVMDVLIPAAKKLVSDVVRDGIDMLLYGEAHRRSSSGPSTASYVNYNSVSTRRPSTTVRSAARYNFDDIIIESRGEAEEVLTRMEELLATYGMVSVADLYDLVGITCDYTDNKYGWMDLRGADLDRTRDGYRLVLPRVVPLN